MGSNVGTQLVVLALSAVLKVSAAPLQRLDAEQQSSGVARDDKQCDAGNSLLQQRLRHAVTAPTGWWPFDRGEDEPDVQHPEDFVNVLAGSGGSHEHSTGNTLPITALPWGFNHWAPMSNAEIDPGFWFNRNHDDFHGIRCTHQPSPWMRDWGTFRLLPQVADDQNQAVYPASSLAWIGTELLSTPWIGKTNYDMQPLRPYLMELTVGPLDVNLQLAPTMHGAIVRAVYPENLARGKNFCVQADPGDIAFGQGDGECIAVGDSIRLVTRSDERRRTRLYAHLVSKGLIAYRTGKDKCCWRLHDSKAEILIGTSLLSSSQAEHAMREEVLGRTLEEVAEEGRKTWRELLNRVQVVDIGAGKGDAVTSRKLGIFYTCLYRTLLFPHRLDENTPDGLRYAPVYGGGKHNLSAAEGVGVTGSGYWDTFRTVYPLLALAYPHEYGTLVQGMLNAYRDGGWLPQWPNPGYTGTMSGSFADIVVSDAIIKGIPGFNRSTAFAALLRDADDEGFGAAGMGRAGLHDYVEKGYIPSDGHVPSWVSSTLNMAFADRAIANAATQLGHPLEAQRLWNRSAQALPALYDQESHLLAERDHNGHRHTTNFLEWGYGFEEGSQLHHSFPPYDLDELVHLHGDKDKLLERMRGVLSTPATFTTGSYGSVIHEMTELSALGTGQYAHNDQAMHHFPYLFALLGARNDTVSLVRKTMQMGYNLEGFSGDEDTGEMGAWYVLSALGLYAVAPGVSEDYVLGAPPLFARIRLHAIGLDLVASSGARAAEEAPAVCYRNKTAAVAGAPCAAISEAAVAYSMLGQGGELVFARQEEFLS